MKNTQLLKMFGEIDNKFLDEALGGDSEKPLKIDTSRAPVKWYRIAAPIAACLVLGAGIITLSRFINTTTPVDPPAVSDYSGTVDPLEDGYYAQYPMFSADNVPTVTMLELSHGGIDDEDKVNATMFVKKFGEYDICITADNVFHIAGESKNDTVFVEELSLSLIKDGKRLSYAKFPDTDTVKAAVSQYRFDADISNFSVEIYGYSNAAVAAVRSNIGESGDEADCAFFGIFDENIKLLRGTGIDGGEPTSSVSFSRSLKKSTNSLIDNINKLEYKFDFNAFGSDNTPHFTTEIFSAEEKPGEDLFAVGMKDAFPDLSARDIPVSDSPYLDPEEPSEIERAKITNIRLVGTDLFVSLVGENIFSLVEDGGRNMRMDKMSVILFKRDFETFKEDDKLLAIVDIDPIAADETGSRHGNIIVRPYNDAFELYHLDDVDIIAIGDGDYIRSDGANCNFVALTKEGKLILLKGTGLNDDTVSPRVSMSGRLAVSGNSLLDPENGIEFSFFPEMFNYANPDADHAHFKCEKYNALSGIKGGYVYNPLDDSVPSKECYGYLDGTQEDLDRWNSFILSVTPAVIHASKDGESKHDLSDINANALFTIVKTAKLTVGPDNPTAGGFGVGIVGCDSDGNVLFEVYYDYTVTGVAFDDSGKFYEFDSSNSGLESIFNFLGKY